MENQAEQHQAEQTCGIKVENGKISWNGVVASSASLADVKITVTAPKVDAAAREAMNFSASQMRESVMASGLAIGPLVEALRQMGRYMGDLHERLTGKATEMPSGILFVADAQGRVKVGGYEEDLEWMHGLLTLRYGSGPVSPIGQGMFYVSKVQIVRQHPRWMMYLSIDQ